MRRGLVWMLLVLAVLTGIDAWIDGLCRSALRPAGSLTVSDWADRHRFVSASAASEPGPWRTSRTPYLREIMDVMSPSSPVRRAAFMKGTQLGGTEAGNNWMGYIVDEAPGPTMMVLPTSNTARRSSRTRLDRLFEETPVLKRRLGAAVSRDGSNTTFLKAFQGGYLVIAGANSAAELRSMPVKYLFLDEIDSYPLSVDEEGDPVELAIKRTETFPDRKVFEVSSPKLTGSSRIESTFDRSDQRRYFVPCPDCGEFQVLAWKNVVWKRIGRAAANAAYACEHCGSVIEESQKIVLLERGEWRPTATSSAGIAGFHLSALYSPWFSWGEAAEQFEASLRDEDKRRVFVNTVLAESYAAKGEAPEWRRLYDRREDYEPGRVPAGGLVLTAGGDVQRDRIELEVVAWGPRLESWSVDYLVLEGDPADGQVWAELSAIVQQSWPHESGQPLRIRRLAIDSGGHYTPQTYAWSRKHPGVVMAVKGVDTSDYVLSGPRLMDIRHRDGRKMKRGAKLWLVGVSGLKKQLYSQLELDLPTDAAMAAPDGYCHLPSYDADHFKQLTAEQLVDRKGRNGKVRKEWRLTYHRNEALDCRVYALAAAHSMQLDRRSLAEWQRLRDELGVDSGQPELPLSTETEGPVPGDGADMTPTGPPLLAAAAIRPRAQVRVIPSSYL